LGERGQRTHIDLLILNLEDPLLALMGVDWEITTVDVIVLHPLKVSLPHRDTIFQCANLMALDLRYVLTRLWLFVLSDSLTVRLA
jgi:hypothetical protein